ncbi:MAG: GGDEF domain-containing protein [Clostridia bacterium]|nr:GGDEF domain-containing protein [Clostridia bacterium]
MPKSAEAKPNTVKRGLPLRGILYALLILGLALAAALVVETFFTNSSYTHMRESTEIYIDCENCVNDLQTASDYLTAEVRAFTMTEDISHVVNYFNELNNAKRRENAVATLRRLSDDDEIVAHLQDALNYSNELTETELYIMRLMFEARGSGMNRFPEVEKVELMEKHAGLSAARLVEDAKSMAFDKSYQLIKDNISASANECMSLLLTKTREEDARNASNLSMQLFSQRVLIYSLIGVILLAGILTTTMIISPVNKSATCVKKQEFIPIKGSREMRTLAARYNKMFEENRIKNERLSYEATHDALTDLCNRAVFENECRAEESEGKAVLALDIDNFKEVNDHHGHDTGDAVLKKTATLLKAHFRANDRICRIGGDEFVIVMDDISPEIAGLVKDKFREVHAALNRATGSIPAASISAGLAFGKAGLSVEALYKNADTALYEVKNTKKGEFKVYGA